MLDSIFLQVSVLLGITVTAAVFMRMLRQPLMTAYLIAGIIAGPFFLDLLHGDTQLFDALAQFGVVLLLFVVGLSLNIEHIKRMGKVALSVGLIQVSFTAAAGFLILRQLGFEAFPAAYLGLAMTFSSTIIIVKLLSDKKDAESVYGRYVLGLMVVQDIIALLLLLIVNSFSANTAPADFAAQMVVKIILLAAFVYFLGRVLIPRILDHVASSGEFLFIFTVAWCFGVASIIHSLGFSVEVGALIAGLTLGSSPYQAEISSRVKPLRDFFIVLFFIILGSQLQLANLNAVLVPGIILSIFILIGQPFILYFSFRAFQFTRRNSFLASVIAAQVSEFGFILLLTGKRLGHLQGTEMEVFTLVALITIIISSYVITYNEQLYHKMLPLFEFFGKDKYRQKEEKIKRYHVWVFGYHRIGWKVCETLTNMGVSFAVVDFNPATISKLKHRGIPAYYGDASDVEFLSQLHLEKAKMVISTLPEVDDQHTLIRHIRKRSKRTIIIANLYEIESLNKLYRAGADYVMMPHLLGGSWMATVLQDKRWSKKTFATYKQEQKKEMTLRATAGTHE